MPAVHGKIYMLESNQFNLFYYGSTKNTLTKRMGQHRCSFKKNPSYGTAGLLMGCDDVKIVLVEKFLYVDKDHLKAREAFYIRNNLCVNKQIPGRTKAEWDIDNAIGLSEYRKIYREDNAVVISEKAKLYYAGHREERRQYIADNRESISEYQKENREHRSQGQRERRALKKLQALTILTPAEPVI